MKKLPLWLKLLAALLLLSMVGTTLASVSPHIIPAVLILVLMIFPGKDPKHPWIIRLVPWFWGLDFVMGLFFLVGVLIGKDFFPSGGDVRLPTTTELWATVLLLPILIVTFLKRSRFFKPALIIISLISIGLSISAYMESAQAIKDVLELVGNVLTEILLAAYLLVKMR